jgi:AraC-like DNA-binding protein/TolB-like protein/Tfp pilus assembly protein PilF
MIDQAPTDKIFIENLNELIQSNLKDENFGPKELSRKAAVNRHTLNRRIKAITGKTLNQFIRETRLNTAHDLLQSGYLTASEVAYRVGFRSAAYFNTCFHEFFGYPPGKAKKINENDALAESMTPLNAYKAAESSWRMALIFTRYRTVILSGLIVTIGLLFLIIRYRAGLKDDLISSNGRISIAVMPFRNMTSDNNWNIWQDAIQEDLINTLSNNPDELEVRQVRTITGLLNNKDHSDYASLTLSGASNISRRLEANVFIYGNIQRAGRKLRLSARLINSKSEKILRSFEMDGPCKEEIILDLTDSLRKQIRDYLLVSMLNKQTSLAYKDLLGSTRSPEALRNFIYGQQAYSRLEFPAAIKFYSQAIAIDSNFVSPYIYTFYAYKNNGQLKEARKWSSRVFAKRDLMTIPQKGYASAIYASCYETPNESITAYRNIIGFDDQLPDVHSDLGSVYCYLYQYDNAIPEFKRTLEIYDKWGVKPFWGTYYSWLALAYQKTGQYRKEKKVLSRAEKEFPNDPEIMYLEIELALIKKDTSQANIFIRKYIAARRVQSWPEARIKAALGIFYKEAGLLDKSEEYFRLALGMDPENPLRMRDLAYFLIDKDRNQEEGMELADKVLALDPDDSIALECKGWGLYKQGKYQASLDLLQKSWDVRLAYRHSLYLHLQDVKKAVEQQKKDMS